MTGRESMRERFRELLTGLFVDNTVDEALELWRYRVEHTPHVALQQLVVLDEILAGPPPDLVELMEADGWIHLFHRPDKSTLTPYSFEEYRAWLADITERLRAAYDAQVRSP
jgi:hypothetical protein